MHVHTSSTNTTASWDRGILFFVDGRIADGQGLKSVTSNSTQDFAAAVAVAKSADHVLVFVGLDTSVEEEGHDRHNITLPGWVGWDGA